jgi:hypothetical protein
VPERPRFIGKPGWVRSKAWIGFLVNREHDRVRRRVDIKPDHVAQLGGKLRVAAELKRSQPVWRQAMGAPDLLHRTDRQAHGTGHRSTGPRRGLAWGIAECALDQPRDDPIGYGCLAGFAGLVMQQTIDPRFHKPALPAPDAGFRHAGPAHHLCRAATFCRGQDNSRPPYMLLRTIAIGERRFQPLPIPRPQPYLNIASHPRTMAHNSYPGNLLYRSDHSHVRLSK